MSLPKSIFPGFTLAMSCLVGTSLAEDNLDNRLHLLAEKGGLDTSLANTATIRSLDDPIVQLGKKLFFSTSTSGGFDVACASCHHPQLSGGDGLSLPVGTAAKNPLLVGPGRKHAAYRFQDPRADGAPNVARNSPTTFNSVFFKKALFHDGRVFLQKDLSGDYGTRTPDSLAINSDPDAGLDLLGAQSRFPIVAGEEMRGPNFEKNSPNAQVRRHLAGRLGNYGPGLGELSSASWESEFRVAFGDRESDVEDLVSFTNISKALSAYQSSQVFLNSPWNSYLSGNDDALSDAAKRGAILFLTSVEDGGTGCSSCHSGNFFTDENFHNIATPQIGRGQRNDGSDRGRYEISKAERDLYAFRTPSLLNVSATGPYLHSGAYNSLNDVVRHHLDPRAAIANYDFSLESLPQFAGSGYRYPNAEKNTLAALDAYEKHDSRGSINLTDAQVSDLVAFLQSLTDPCVIDDACVRPWVFTGSGPDGKNLAAVFGEFKNDPAEWGSDRFDFTQRAKDVVPSDILPDDAYTTVISSIAPNKSPYVARDTPAFSDATADLDVEYKFEWDIPRLLEGVTGHMNVLSFFGPLQNFGGVAAGDYDRDGYVDLYVARGNSQGNVLLHNLGNGRFEDKSGESATSAPGHMTAGAMFADVDGDSWLDLLVTGHRSYGMRMFRNGGDGEFTDVSGDAGLDATRDSQSTAFADIDRDGDLDLAVGRWSTTPGEDNHIFLNDGDGVFTPSDREIGFLVARFSNTDLSFTPSFTDIDGDNWTDLLLAGDFKTSQIFRNLGGGVLADITDRGVVTDENAMGAALADYDNDGDEDWFVTSIHDRRGNDPKGRWFASGNKLYRNDGGTFTDVSAEAGITQGYWGWGTCFLDVDNDGNQDIFHVNGYGNLSDEVISSLGINGLKDAYQDFKVFADTTSKLFHSNGDGTFTDASAYYSLDIASEGRGISCLDYDRDGDTDIFITNNSQAPILLRNNHNLANGNSFVSVRLAQPGKNTQAIGAKVRVSADGKTWYRQLGLNSNYLSQNPAELHFGLGQARKIDKLEVTWPGGAPVSSFTDLPVNAHYEIKRIAKEDGDCCDTAAQALRRAREHFSHTYEKPRYDSLWILRKLAGELADRDLAAYVTNAIDETNPSPMPANYVFPDSPSGVDKLIAYIFAPFLPDEQRAHALIDEFTSEPAEGYVLTHQLFVLLWSREFDRFEDSPLYSRIPRLIEKIAEEQARDPVLSDMFLERAALLMMYSNPTPEEARRWRDAAVAAQLPSGGWPRLRWEIKFDGERKVVESAEHTDVLALSVLGFYQSRFK